MEKKQIMVHRPIDKVVADDNAMLLNAPQWHLIRRYRPYQRPIVRRILFWLNRS